MSARREQVETDVVLRLLDHQLVGRDGDMLGNVDDLELVRGDAGWLVTGLMVGPAALSRRLPGMLGHWMYAVWRRLHPDPDPSALVVPLEHVLSIDSAVHVDDVAARALSVGFALELWLREHVVSRLPGVTRPTGAAGAPPVVEHARRGEPLWPLRPPVQGSYPLSQLLRRPVLSYAGARMGWVCELRCLGRPHDERQEPLEVRRLLYTPRLAGWQLGYSSDPRQGPWLVRRVERSRRHRDRIVDLEQVQGLERLGEPDGDVVLTPAARPQRLDVGD